MDAEVVDPGGSAVGVHDPDRHRGLLDDPPVLGRLHGSRPRLRALLLLPELLRLLDAAAGPRRQLRDPDRRLGVRRRRLLPADLLLVPAHDRHRGRDQGVRDQRRRRRRASCWGPSSSSSTPTRSTSCSTFHAVEHGAFGFSPNNGDLVAGCVLLLVGAFAKSAQIPLHTWLPDAMEGPTPVSALIHAATMVTAGVYLIARMHPLFERAPAAQDVGAVIGCATLLIAATIALVQTDIKRVIAYSTMSQIGYMIMGVSVGAYAAGLFHLMTHAFFKALLFMGAGSLIGAMAGEQSLDRMGGFRKAMPFTYGCFLIGGLALSGVPPFSGFFSKDEILLDTGERGGWHWALYGIGYLGRAADRDLHLPDDLPGLPRRAGAGGARARRRPPAPRRRALQPGQRRRGGPRRRLPRPDPRDRRTGLADGGRDGRAGGRGDPRRARADPESGRRDHQLPAAAPSSTPATTAEPTKEGLLVFGLGLGTVLALVGIAIAHRVWVVKPGTSDARARAAAVAVRAAQPRLVLQRADRRARRAPDGGRRGVREEHLRAHLRGRDPDRRHDRDRARRARPRCAPCRTASCATTPRC